MTARRRPAGRGVLVILALLLAASGALRLGSGFGTALARAPEIGAAPIVCPEPPVALAEALRLREARVATQEAAVADRLAALALADQTVTTRLDALAAAEAELAATLALADGAAEGDLARLTRVYETMKPKDAAALFAAMAPDFAAGFLARMKPEAAAAVLAGMQAEQAYAVSVILASRNAGVPTE
jgi:flagellar motility protein MotE (MotC chaperone)